MIEVGRVAMIQISSVIVQDRTREEMGDLEAMRANMKENGLITPLAVKDLHNGTYKLLGGERRFRVISSEEGNTEIPARIYDRDLNELEMALIEESENLYRKDMTWIERDKLTKKIHDLNQSLYGAKPPGPSQEGWGTRDTAEAIGAKSPIEVTHAIKRATLFEEHPELFEGCKTASDATKVVNKIAEAAIKQQLAAKIETESLDIQLKKLNDAYIIRNFFEGVKSLPDNLFHLVEIDPPYGISLREQKRKSDESQYQLDSYNEVDGEEYPQFLEKLFKECYRVMTENSWMICWFGPEPWYQTVYKELHKAGFYLTRTVGIWTKNGPGQCNQPNIYLANSYEMFFYARKGKPVINKAGHSNVFNFSTVPPTQKIHPTERPIELMEELYTTFAFPGSRLLIPFLGSGNGLLAAAKVGISAMGFELSKSYKDSFLVKAHNLSKKQIQ